MQTSHLKMRWDNLNSPLTERLSGQQGLRLLKCCLDLHSCELWPHMNPGRMASSWIMNKYGVPKHINHHQSRTSQTPSIHNVDICTKLIQTIDRIPWLTGKRDVGFISFNTGLFTECEMLKDFKTKLTETQCSSQKSDKQPSPARENRLIYPLILLFSAAGESQARSHLLLNM